jgi:acyl-CoA reductase-like NAD-dependent aldehyde dehydrogenase
VADGVLVDVEVFVNLPYGYDIRCELVCESGTLALGDGSPVILRKDGYRSDRVPETFQERFGRAYDTEFQEWVDSIVAGQATGKVRRGIEVVEFACGMPTLMMGETVRNVANGIDNVSYRFPLGVVAAIVPFNFPAMIPLWTMPIAIGAGNTYVLKPSERTPLSSQRIVELLMEAGLPDGVVNIVHGAKDAVNGILEHPDIRAVSFVGSRPTAEYIYRTAAAHGKRVQALSGAKNSLIVMPDAVVGKTIENIMSSAFGNAGERCLAGSVVVAVGSKADQLVEALRERAAAKGACNKSEQWSGRKRGNTPCVCSSRANGLTGRSRRSCAAPTTAQ